MRIDRSAPLSSCLDFDTVLAGFDAAVRVTVAHNQVRVAIMLEIWHESSRMPRERFSQHI